MLHDQIDLNESEVKFVLKYALAEALFARKDQERKESTMKGSKNKKSLATLKKKRLHRWEQLIKVVQWLVEHQVPQTIIRLVMWLADFGLQD